MVNLECPYLLLARVNMILNDCTNCQCRMQFSLNKIFQKLASYYQYPSWACSVALSMIEIMSDEVKLDASDHGSELVIAMMAQNR